MDALGFRTTITTLGLATSEPWSRHRWFYALAVLLPSIVDIGVSLRNGNDYYWKDSPHAHMKSALFHSLHLAGWFTLSLLGFAVSRHFK